jgi:predicted nucleic acid-binding protein
VSYLIDTNIISEIRKGERCDAHVAAWYASVADDELYLSTLVLGEIRKGIELARRHDAAKARALERWLRDVETAFGRRVLGIDNAVADQWGRMSAIRPVPAVDGLLAATARVNDLTLVTRNAGDVAGLDARVLDPFEHKPSADVSETKDPDG